MKMVYFKCNFRKILSIESEKKVKFTYVTYLHKAIVVDDINFSYPVVPIYIIRGSYSQHFYALLYYIFCIMIKF